MAISELNLKVSSGNTEKAEAVLAAMSKLSDESADGGDWFEFSELEPCDGHLTMRVLPSPALLELRDKLNDFCDTA